MKICKIYLVLIIIIFTSFLNKFNYILYYLQAQDARIIVVYAYPDMAQKILCTVNFDNE